MTTANSPGFLAKMVIAEEVTKGTSPAISTGLRDYFTDDPGINPEPNIIDLGNAQHRHIVDHVMSDYHMVGSVPQIVTPGGHIGYWLGMAIGNPTSAQQGGTSAYKHTYSPANDLKTFSMWYQRGGNQQIVMPYGLVNTLTLDQGVDDVLRSSIDIYGRTETINSDDFSTAGAYDIIEPFHNMDLTVTGPTNASQAHKSTLVLSNNYNLALGKVHGSRFYEAAVPGKRSITGTIELWFDDDGDVQRFWGSTSDTTPNVDGIFSTVPLNFKWDTNVEADTGYNYALEIDIPGAMYKTSTVTIGDRIKQSIGFSAQYDTVDAYEVEAYLTNTTVSYP